MKAASALALLSIAGLSATNAAAQNFTSHNDLDKRPVTKIAAELGVEPEEFAACFTPVEPARDFNPTPEHERANKAKLLPCLQAANGAITNDRLDRVMDKYRGQHIGN